MVSHETETASSLEHLVMVLMSNCCLDDIILALDSDMITFVFFCFACTCLSSVSITGNNVIIILVEVTHIRGGIWEQTVQRNAYTQHWTSAITYTHTRSRKGLL